MRNFARLLILVCVVAACSPGEPNVIKLRIATFNIAMGLPKPGMLGEKLTHGLDFRLQQVAEILQRVRPDIVVLNEFDYDPDFDAAGLFNEQYLSRGWNGQQAIHYPHSYRNEVNTGMDSGLDLDGNGKTGDPQDAWGYGSFPGQYGMLVLSRFPIRQEAVRTFQHFPWASLPAAKRPLNPDGGSFYSDDVWKQLRLSSKSHWDLPIDIDGRVLHLLVHHPTPPVFDGPEDRNGKRNYDETRFWLEYLGPGNKDFIVDDRGNPGGLSESATFIIAGDLNADTHDGDSLREDTHNFPSEDTHNGNSMTSAVGQLLAFPLIDASCTPLSVGGMEASRVQGGINKQNKGDPAADTSDFNDEHVGNLRLDYVLPSKNISVSSCGVFWPASDEDGHQLVEASDHRLVWLDISL
jgi:endonuclease/exonuclease/phosphatase family metal-dependent hydrolase